MSDFSYTPNCEPIILSGDDFTDDQSKKVSIAIHGVAMDLLNMLKEVAINNADLSCKAIMSGIDESNDVTHVGFEVPGSFFSRRMLDAGIIGSMQGVIHSGNLTYGGNSAALIELHDGLLLLNIVGDRRTEESSPLHIDSVDECYWATGKAKEVLINDFRERLHKHAYDTGKHLKEIEHACSNLGITPDSLTGESAVYGDTFAYSFSANSVEELVN